MTMPGYGSLVALLRQRASDRPDAGAYVFLGESGDEVTALTFAELERRALSLAGRLAARGGSGDRALLVFPPGLDFLVGLFACLAAGIIAVPMMLPRRNSARDTADSIVADCAPRFALTVSGLMTGARADLAERFVAAGLDRIMTDAKCAEGAPAAPLPAVKSSDIALLQYTSGSTSAPKGVMLSHRNLLANLEMIRVASGNTESSAYVSWVPLYHDMGLILNALQSIYVGALCVLMAPVAFVQHPLRWLRAIARYRAEVAGGPNFAFDLCVTRYRREEMRDVDLSCWKVAVNGAEPVRAETIRRFAETFAPHGFDPRAFWPAYGMAEAAVLISAGHRGRGAPILTTSRGGLQQHRIAPPADANDVQELVGCGRELVGESIAIVDPESRQRLAPRKIGEIWVAGPNVAQGYWRNGPATEAAFAACIDGDASTKWLRTGDLGFLDETGELFITGRLKELIIIRGINHYPQDIEATAQRSHPGLAAHGGAAFAVGDADGSERLVVVHEVERTQRHRFAAADIVAAICEAIIDKHEIAPHRVVLLRPGSLPKTSSGKIRRLLARDLWRRGRLPLL
jgi:acyl-CoA synthetase (AMP-forming)/AMP-acid ligase II